MLETEGNEENKEDNPWIVVLVIPVSMNEQDPLAVSGLLRSLCFLLLIAFLLFSIPHRPNILAGRLAVGLRPWLTNRCLHGVEP
jgi:hypothetical protein